MSIDKFIESNKGWFDFYNKTHTITADNVLWINLWEDVHVRYDGVEDFLIIFLNYFKDWKQPTKEEQDYFQLCEGYRLSWSEDHPFVWED